MLPRFKSAAESSNHLSRLHPESQKYALALMDPFSPNATHVTCPVDGHPAARHKAVTEDTVVFAATITDIICFVNPSVANNVGSLFIVTFTAAQYATWLATGTGTGSWANSGTYDMAIPSGLPYGGNTLTPGFTTQIDSRLISFGLKVSYVGAQSNRGGIGYWYEDPGHQDIYGGAFTNGNNIISVAQNDPNRKIVQFNFKPGFEFVMTPHDDSEFGFYNSRLDAAAGGAGADGTTANRNVFPFTQGFIAPPGLNNTLNTTLSASRFCGPTTFFHYVNTTGVVGALQFSTVSHVEFKGRLASTSMEPSHSEPTKARVIASSVRDAKLVSNSVPHEKLITTAAPIVNAALERLVPKKNKSQFKEFHNSNIGKAVEDYGTNFIMDSLAAAML